MIELIYTDQMISGHFGFCTNSRPSRPRLYADNKNSEFEVPYLSQKETHKIHNSFNVSIEPSANIA